MMGMRETAYWYVIIITHPGEKIPKAVISRGSELKPLLLIWPYGGYWVGNSGGATLWQSSANALPVCCHALPVALPAF